MKIIVHEISLSNWFNFKGSYEENNFKFLEGTNILVGDNNAGKTKLHNAFRWILKNSVVLEKADKAEEFEINDSNILSVFNQAAYDLAQLNDTLTLGVEVHFEEIKLNESHHYVLRKEISFKKDVAKRGAIAKDLDFIEKVYKYNPRGGIRTIIHEEFKTYAHKIILPIYQNYFFIEGEQLGLMTPLEGGKLKTTINAIVDIHFLDELESRSMGLNKSIQKEKRNYEASEENASDERLKSIERIQELEEANEKINRQIGDEKLEYAKNDKIVKDYKNRAEHSKKRKEQLKEYNDLIAEVEDAEKQQEQYKQDYISSYIKLPNFTISKLDDDTELLEDYNEFIRNINSFISARRAELNTKLSKEEEEMLMALEKSQPKPEILERMLDKGKCFVCTSELNEESETYMKNKLIPFFKDELEDDLEINKLVELSEFFKSLKFGLEGNWNKDLSVFDSFDKNIEDSTQDLVSSRGELDKFIEINGHIDENDEDEINLNTYGRAVEEMTLAMTEIENLKKQLTINNEEIRALEEEEQNDDVSDDLKKIRSLSHFTSDLEEFLIGLKKLKYHEFAENLSEKATKRFQGFMKHNLTAKNHKIDVATSENPEGKIEFKIRVIDEYGNNQEQPGGADQALRRVAVVFGLLDYADSKNEYPFIADAPVSKLSPDTKMEFFKSLSDDDALSQTIVMTMDLWSAQAQDLNELGKRVLSYFEGDPDSQVLIMKPKPNNSGVTITKA